MEQHITKNAHKYADHVTNKIPPFGRAVIKKQKLQYFNPTANKCRNDNNFKNGE